MRTVAVAGGSRPEILELVQKSKTEINTKISFKIFDTEPDIDETGIWEYIQCDSQEEMLYQTVNSAVEKKSDIILKGNVQTHFLLKEVLKKEHQLKKEDLLSHVALVNLPALERKLLLTDAAINIEPTEEQLGIIIKHAVETGHNIGIAHPKVAIISAAENLNKKMSSSVLANTLTERFKDYSDATIHGPLSLDLSLSKEAVKKKRYEGPIEGDADVLIVPTIDVGNVLYKSFVLFGGATMGGTIVGTKVPIVLTSRSDDSKSKLESLKFALMQLGESEI